VCPTLAEAEAVEDDLEVFAEVIIVVNPGEVADLAKVFVSREQEERLRRS
jgi:hypothetical protein